MTSMLTSLCGQHRLVGEDAVVISVVVILCTVAETIPLIVRVVDQPATKLIELHPIVIPKELTGTGHAVHNPKQIFHKTVVDKQ